MAFCITHVRSWAWASSCSACRCLCWCCRPPSQALALPCASWVFPARLQSRAPCLRCRSPPTSHPSHHTLQLAAEVERMGAASGGVSVSLDAVYSMFNTACAATFRDVLNAVRHAVYWQVRARQHHGPDAGAVDGAGPGHASNVLAVWQWNCGVQVRHWPASRCQLFLLVAAVMSVSRV